MNLELCVGSKHGAQLKGVTYCVNEHSKDTKKKTMGICMTKIMMGLEGRRVEEEGSGCMMLKSCPILL